VPLYDMLTRCAQAILSANSDAVEWLKSQLRELKECKIEDSRRLSEWEPKDFLDRRIHYWFNDYDMLVKQDAEDSGEVHQQEMIWQKVPSIFVMGSVSLAMVHILGPALNFLSCQHDQTSDEFVTKILRNDYQLLCVSLSQVDSQLLRHKFDESMQSQHLSDKCSGALEEHRLAVQLWDICHGHKSCDPQEMIARKTVANLLTEFELNDQENDVSTESNDQDNDGSPWFMVSCPLCQMYRVIFLLFCRLPQTAFL
jgi:hypothetical protein